MGISSNQARFLTLTGRKCDIEYRMQNICQRRLAIANETQRASQLYNDAMSNRKLFINEMSAGSQFGGLTQGNDLSTVAELTAARLNDNGYWIVDTNDPENYQLFQNTVMGIGAIRTGANLAANKYPNINDTVTINNVTYKVGSVNSYQTATRPNITNFSQPDNTFARTGFFAAGTTNNEVPAAVTSYSTPTISSTDSTTGFRTYSYSATRPSDYSIQTRAVISGTISTVDLDEYEPTLFAFGTSGLPDVVDTLNEESKVGMDAVIASCTNINNDPNNLDLEVVTYQTPVLIGSNEDGSPIYEMKTINSIKINTQAGFDAVMDLLEDNSQEQAKKQNYVLNGDFTMDNQNANDGWTAITAFSGMFDGNGHTISWGAQASNDLALFYSGSGAHFQNINIDMKGQSFDSSNSTDSMALVARMNNGSTVSNCGVIGSYSNEGNQGYYDFGVLIGTAYTGTQAIVDRCYACLDSLNTTGSAGLICVSRDRVPIVVSNSYVSVKNKSNDISNENFVIGQNSSAPTVTQYNNSYKNGDNQSVGGRTDTSSVTLQNEATMFVIQEYYTYTEKVKNGTYQEYPSSYNLILEWTDDNEAHLEEYLRSGRYKLVREADVYTQNPTNFDGKNYEFVDWRNVPIISDALDTSDDAEAQTNYDRTIRDLNEQDKILEMEMQKLDTEYTAVNAERDSLTKILDTNVKGSFKYFS